MMNSTQHSIRSSRASRAKVMLPSEEDLLREGVARISEMIFWTVAGRFESVSFGLRILLFAFELWPCAWGVWLMRDE